VVSHQDTPTSQHCLQEVLDHRPFKFTDGLLVGQCGASEVHAAQVANALVNDHDLVVHVASEVSTSWSIHCLMIMAIAQPHFPPCLLELKKPGLHASTSGRALSVYNQIQAQASAQAAEEPGLQPWMIILEGGSMNFTRSTKLHEKVVVEGGFVEQLH
jgi:hypothetical protein